MAALWGENPECDIRDAMWNNTVARIKVALLVVVFLIAFTSPAWLWFLFNNQTVTETRFNKTDDERNRIGESNRARERQTEEWNRKHFGVK